MGTSRYWQLICVLLLTELYLVLSVTADCQENEFEHESGTCLPCKQCGPGQELSEDCGSGRDLQCVPCRPGRYKEDRGHQRCLRCLPCSVINRVLKANCTPTLNSICGDCLPGFYSKTRIGGLQELECFPCTSHTPSTESQCNAKPAPNQPASTASPPRDPVVLVAVILVALALILVTLVTLSVLCCGRFFKSQCQRAFHRSQNFAGRPGRVAESWETTSRPQEEQPIPPCCFGSPRTCRQAQGQGHPGAAIMIRSLLLARSDLIIMSPLFIGSAAVSTAADPELTAIDPEEPLTSRLLGTNINPYNAAIVSLKGLISSQTSSSRAPYETGPLEEVCVTSNKVSPSTRAKCSENCALQPRLELSPIPPAPAKPHYTRSISETQPLIRNSGCSDCFSGCTPTSDPSQAVSEHQSTQTHSCASEQHHWSHAPVECTELDLQNFSTENGLSDQSLPESSHGPLSIPGSHVCACMDIIQGGSSSLPQRDTRTLCRHHPHTSMPCEDPTSHLNSAALGLHISRIPSSLVLSLGLSLDPSMPGLKDFRDLGVALGVSSQLLTHMQGFVALHAHLSTRSSCTLQDLVKTLQNLARQDALSVICKHFEQ